MVATIIGNGGGVYIEPPCPVFLISRDLLNLFTTKEDEDNE